MQFILGIICAVVVLMNWNRILPVILSVLESITNFVN